MYERLFDQKHRGWRELPRYVAWVAIVLGLIIADGFIILAATRRLFIRPAVLTANLWVALGFFSSLYFSSVIIDDSKIYGTLGVVFTS